jgi:hypothetical protein
LLIFLFLMKDDIVMGTPGADEVELALIPPVEPPAASMSPTPAPKPRKTGAKKRRLSAAVVHVSQFLFLISPLLTPPLRNLRLRPPIHPQRGLELVARRPVKR